MAERYSRVFLLDGEYYSNESPVVVEAGALLKDNVNGSIIAQLKFKNVSDKAIISICVDLEIFDVSGKLFPEKAAHQYLDLVVNPYEVFGQKEPILVTENTTRSFSIHNIQAVFADKSIWNSEKQAWTKLPAVEPISNRYVDSNSLAEYKDTICSAARILPYEVGDLWRCACGSLNHLRNEACHSCKSERVKVFSADPETLRLDHLYKTASQLLSNSDDTDGEKAKQAASIFASLNGWKDSETLQETASEKFNSLQEKKRAKELQEQKEAEEKRRNAERIRRKIKYGIITGISLAILVFIAVVVTKNIIMPTLTYSKAKHMIAEKRYDEAVGIFDSLGIFKDSLQMRDEAVYLKALDLMEEEEYEEAAEAFDSILNYKDSNDLRDESYYAFASELMKEDIFAANSIYSKIKGYKDVDSILEKLEIEIKYVKAVQALEAGNFDSCISKFEALGDYKDSVQKLDEAKAGALEKENAEKQTRYDEAAALFKQGKIDEAEVIFKEIKGFSDSADKIKECENEKEYIIASDLYAAGNGVDSFEAFLALGDYRDSSKRVIEALGLALSKGWLNTTIIDYIKQNLSQFEKLSGERIKDILSKHLYFTNNDRRWTFYSDGTIDTVWSKSDKWSISGDTLIIIYDTGYVWHLTVRKITDGVYLMTDDRPDAKRWNFSVATY